MSATTFQIAASITSLSLASGFYGSIVLFQCFGWSRAKTAAIVSFAAGPIFACSFAFSAIGSNLLFSSSFSPFIHGMCFASHFWMSLLFGSYFFRDRFRSGYYGSLDQAYLEACADGIMIANVPITGIVCGFLFQGIWSAWTAIQWFKN